MTDLKEGEDVTADGCHLAQWLSERHLILGQGVNRIVLTEIQAMVLAMQIQGLDFSENGIRRD